MLQSLRKKKCEEIEKNEKKWKEWKEWKVYSFHSFDFFSFLSLLGPPRQTERLFSHVRYAMWSQTQSAGVEGMNWLCRRTYLN